MKNLALSLSSVVAAACLSSCAAPVRADVETLERQAPVTAPPNMGQHEAGRNAVDYANDRTSYDRGYGSYRRY